MPTTGEVGTDAVWGSAVRQLQGGMLSVVMPAYNLGKVILENVRHVESAFDGVLPFEIIVVDDGSTDGTREEWSRLAASMPHVRQVVHPHNMGKGEALRSGFEASRGTHVLLLDADLDLPPKQVSRLFQAMELAQADAVIGSKRHPDSELNYPWHRRLTSNVYYWLVKLLLGLPVRDTQTGIKLFKREALRYAFARMLVKRFAFDLELLAILHERGYKVAEAPVLLQYRGTWGCVKPAAIRNIMIDTLAVFYRLRLLRYYQAIRELPMPDPLPRVSVVIAMPAITAYAEECLAGLARQTYRDYEVILLPDEPSGRVWSGVVREVPTGKIRPADKRNLGIQAATGAIVAFLDDDAVPRDNWLEKAMPYFSNGEVAAVGGPATTPSDDPYLARLGGQVYANRLVSGGYVYRYEADRVRDVDDLPTCNLLVRRDVLNRIGGFEPAYWPGEDTILCMRITQELKLRIVYDPMVHVFHHRRKLFLPHLRQISRYATHRGYFARRFPSTSRRIGYMIPSLFVVFLLLGGVVACCSEVLMVLYLSVLGVYGVLTALSCLTLHVPTWVLLWMGIVATHVTYGAFFIRGVLSQNMPGRPARFDHPSEQVAVVAAASKPGGESV